MKAQDVPKLRLNNGLSIPKTGFAAWKSNLVPNKYATGSSFNSVDRIVEVALENGIRHIDCSQRFENLTDVGKGIKSFLLKQKKNVGQENRNVKPVQRKDIWISVKIWACYNNDVDTAIQIILEELDLDYVDTLFLEFPCALKKTANDNKILLYPSYQNKLAFEEKVNFWAPWKAMEKIYKSGKAKTIGLANFNMDQVSTILKFGSIKPQLVQIEMHPLLQQTEFRKFLAERGIACIGYTFNVAPKPDRRSISRPRVAIKVTGSKVEGTPETERKTKMDTKPIVVKKNLERTPSELELPESVIGDPPVLNTPKTKRRLPKRNPRRVSKSPRRKSRSRIGNPDTLQPSLVYEPLPEDLKELQKRDTDFTNPMNLRSICAHHSCSAGRIVQAWCLHENCAVISSTWEIGTIKNHQAVFNVKLSKEEMKQIAALNKNQRFFTFDAFKHHKDYPFKAENSLKLPVVNI